VPARVTFPAVLSNIYPSMRNRKHSADIVPCDPIQPE
jgi:hypothetical protein